MYQIYGLDEKPHFSQKQTYYSAVYFVINMDSLPQT